MRKVIWSLVVVLAVVLGALAAFPAAVIDEAEPIDSVRENVLSTIGMIPIFPASRPSPVCSL